MAGTSVCAGQHVIGERGRERLPLAVVGHLLVERRADALRGAAVDLAVDDHRVHERAAVFDDDIVEQLDLARVRCRPRPRRRGRHN